MLLALTARNAIPQPAQLEQPTQVQESVSPRSHSSSQPSQRSTLSTISASQAISLLASQVPEFGGTESENVQLWIQRIDQVARIHRVPDDVILLAASSKLTNIARKWYDIGSGSMLESWQGFRESILKRFTRRILYHVAIQKVESRKWNYTKETFLEYAMEKITLMHNLELSQESTIHLLISGIGSRSLRELATSLKAVSVDEFLDSMHQIASVSFEHDKRSDTKTPRAKDAVYKPRIKAAASGNQSEKGGTAIICTFCKIPGHERDKCFKLQRRKEQSTQQASSAPASSSSATVPVATVTADESADDDDALIAHVQASGKNIFIQNLALKVSSINNTVCNLRTLVDTGSPISFIKHSIVKKFFYNTRISNSVPKVTYRALNGINNTPSKLLFGYDQRNHMDAPLSEFVNELAKIDTDLELERSRDRNLAIETNEKLKQYNKQYFDKRHVTPTVYKLKDLVMIRNLHAKVGQNSKFDPPYKGPYQIAKILDFDRYLIQDVPGFNLSAKPYTAVLSSDKLKPWIRPIGETSS
ncbi:hypothetical protein ALC57_10313 [Trachymyrmex cornetzi]|uniref:Uncharacterized protein n=1 Tax=Trachymyrmex cornetzi TaxID=471704 RepID=A0A151J489_9HYME|nr:hypothetical protein ALC57_10313 [Trachymyrmex cornetzi]